MTFTDRDLYEYDPAENDEPVYCGYCGASFNDGGGFYCCVECEEFANPGSEF